ncbi:Hsp20/alpha crystallin family protein [Niabella beijingensis]|uniref:Hsp20/alpha crystallin family protein n=1 Tax=Niabella beijingensis TaxID=2872700 RepID=UPI001CC0C0A7|nr:Hsp20/alpha crystallin family protein [Niabella beijingensis]MBZ4190975.1 Hsp20/alpha crystallin family protein [Niabella beijingensis]
MFTSQSIGGNTPHTNFDARFRQQGCSFGKKFGGRFGGRHPWMHKLQQFMNDSRPANIEETDNTFIISLYAAGLQKEQFKISLNEEVLTIRYAAPEDTAASRYIYQEYQPASFERSFQLSNKVLTNEIQAIYTDGVLKVTLQKNPETNKPAQEVPIS